MLAEKLSSVRLTIFLCILLSSVSLIGTLVPQNLAEEQYVRAYGKFWGKAVSLLGFSDMYHSVGFVFLLCLLAVNLMACTTKRFPGVWRSLKRDPGLAQAPDLKAWKNQESFSLSLDLGQGAADLEQAVRRALGRGVQQIKSEPEQRVFLYEKNRFARLGPYLSHLGILIILAGALVGAWLGFNGSVILKEGEQTGTVSLKGEKRTLPLGFQIRCNRFFVEYYEAGQEPAATMTSGLPPRVREYRSEVSLLDQDGKLIRNASIRVNHPLSYQGVTFYQSTFGNSASLSLHVVDRESGQESDVVTEVESPFVLPGPSGDRGVVIDFREDLRIPEEMMRMTRMMHASLGPAVRVGILVREKGFEEPFWVMRDHPEMDERRPGRYHFVLKDFRTVPYTGLQVARDPGAPVVWAGCVLLVLGFLVAFLLDHEILYVVANPTKAGGTKVRVAGRAARHPAIYAGRFARRKAAVQEALVQWLKPAS